MDHSLHYIYDPLCGWCYGATPLLAAAEKIEDLGIVLHGGGLWPQPTTLPEATRQYIQQADARIAAMNGVEFGDAYLNELLLSPDMVLDSTPTIRAVLAAGICESGAEIKMLRAIQHAHYVAGRHVVRREELARLASEIGIEADAFGEAMNDAPVGQHIAETRQLMAKIGAGGFPTFVLSAGARLLGVPHGQFAGNPSGFADWLQQTIRSAA